MSEKVGLYKKISQVMQDVSYLTKDDDIEYKSTKYKAISEEKVTSTVRESLIKNGLIILPIEQEHFKVDMLTTVNVKYKLVDIDTGEYEIITSSGTGVDTQDKGVGKAMTYAFKYLLLRTFAIPTGEDPDKISSAELDDKQKQFGRKNESSKTQQPKIDEKAEYEKFYAEAKGKWVVLAGNTDGFDEFVTKQINKGYNIKQINAYLAKQIQEKKGEN